MQVDGTDTTLHVGAFTYFRGGALEFYWRDPYPEAREPLKVKLPEDAWRHYYAPGLALATADAEDRDAVAVKVEVHDAILDLLLAGDWAAARMRAAELGPAWQKPGFRVDGLRVVAGESWSAKGKRG